MNAQGFTSPPRLAAALLSRQLPPDQRDVILGDLTEMYADRLDAGRRFNRLWFWLQTLGFILGFATATAPRLSPFASPRRMMMGRLATTLRQTMRRLTFEWRYAGGVVLILAVGIGPATAMLSVIQKVLLQPLAYSEPDRLALARLYLGQIQNHPGLTLSEFDDFRTLDDVFAGVEGASRRSEVSLGEVEDLVPLTSIDVTPGLFAMLGVSPAMGRHFTDEDPAADTGRVLLDHDVWQTRFGGADDIVGRSIHLNGGPAEVIGVMPAGFRLTTGRGVPEAIDVYGPLLVQDQRSFWAYPGIVRLADGVTVDQANERLVALAAGLTEQYPDPYEGADLRYVLTPLLDDMVQATRPAMGAAMAGVLLLLLIAVANATALVVARLRTRERDFAIRSAIGAGRKTLVSEVLVESVVLSAAGAIAGTAIAAAGVVAARELVPHTVPRWDNIGIGWELVGYSAVFALVGLFVAGLFPVWKVSRGAQWHALRASSAQGGRAEGSVSRLLLVGAQIALTVVLAFGAAQLVRSAARLSDVDVGFDANVLAFRVPFDGQQFQGAAERAGLYRQVRDRLAELPSVEAVGAISHLPLSGSVALDAFSADLTDQIGSDDPVANYHSVLPGYFASMRMSIVAGRDITDAEFDSGEPVVVVDETLARAAFGADDAIGRTLRLGWGIPDSQVVGVVEHARSIEVERDVRPQVYAPFSTFGWRPLHFTVRTAGDPMLLRQVADRTVNAVGPGRAISNFQNLTDNLVAATSTRRTVTGFVAVLALSAGLLSAIGLYTVIAYVVHQRRRATAIRLALGASRVQLLWHHLSTSGRVMLVALPTGALLALAAAPVFGTLAFGIGERDVTSLAVALIVAALAGLLGTLVPAARAADTDPVTILRGE